MYRISDENGLNFHTPLIKADNETPQPSNGTDGKPPKLYVDCNETVDRTITTCDESELSIIGSEVLRRIYGPLKV